MCVVSMVHDHFAPLIPQAPQWPWNITPTPSTQTISFGTPPNLDKEIAELRKVIAEFREAIAAAKKVDILTGQPDCVDPAKAKLEERIAAIEDGMADVLAGRVSPVPKKITKTRKRRRKG